MKMIKGLIQDIPDEKQAKSVAYKIFISITVAIFIVEMLIMILLGYRSGIFSFNIILFDAAVLTGVISPLIYFFFMRPLMINISKRTISQQNIIKINEKLNQESQRLFRVLDGLPAAVHLLGRDHKIKFANRYFLDNFGTIKEHTCYKLLHGKESPCEICKTFEVFYKGKSEEHEVKRNNDRIYNVYNYPFIDMDGKELVLQLGIDITERKKAENDLKQRERQLNLIVNSMSDTLYTIDKEERITAIYGEGLKSLGIKSDNFIGKKITELFEPEETSDFRKAFQQVLKGENTLLSWETQLPSGNLHLQNALSPVFNENGEVASITGIARNITQQKTLEKKVIESEKLMTVGRMTAMISHEFRNSLTSVRMILELLEESQLIRDNDKKSLNVALKSVTGMENVVNQLLVFSRPSQVTLEKTEIKNIIEETVDLLTPQLDKQGINLLKSYDINSSLIMADALKLKESFVNVLINSVQAISDINVKPVKKEIYISTQKLTLQKPVWNMAVYENQQQFNPKIIWEEKFDNTLAVGTETMVISFSDTGSGIKAENLGQIFDSFFTTRKEGTGLGLAIVKRTVSEHGGVITISTKQDLGTTIKIYLKV